MVTRKRCGLCMHEDREALEAGLESGQINPDMLDREQDWRSGTSAQHLRNHMGDYQQSSNPRCGLCTDPLRKHYEMALSEGTIDAEAVSQALGTTKATGPTPHEAPLEAGGAGICGLYDCKKGSK